MAVMHHVDAQAFLEEKGVHTNTTTSIETIEGSFRFIEGMVSMEDVEHIEKIHVVSPIDTELYETRSVRMNMNMPMKKKLNFQPKFPFPNW